MTAKRTVLTIAGSDCSGGAGIQADIKTVAAHGLFATSVITALTAQNTTGVYGVMNVAPDFVTKQLDCVFGDIFPDAVKIGMVSSAAIASAIAEALSRWGAKNIVVDPVMVATNGGRLMADGAARDIARALFPLADIITPNTPEAEILSAVRITRAEDMQTAAEAIAARWRVRAALIKGGHLCGSADDYFCAFSGGESGSADASVDASASFPEGASATASAAFWLRGDRVDNPNTHGTGCTLSSAIAANLAAGVPMADAVRAAKDYVTGALNAGLNLGKGAGPLDHGWRSAGSQSGAPVFRMPS